MRQRSEQHFEIHRRLAVCRIYGVYSADRAGGDNMGSNLAFK